MGSKLDLIEQLSFYGAYHRHPINQLIHFVFVPAIFFSAEVALCYSGSIVSLPLSTPGPFAQYLPKVLEINAAFFVFLFYALFYLYLNFLVGFTSDIILFGIYSAACAFYRHVGPEKAWKYALVIHLLGWYMQIHPGHCIFEKRRPALLDSFFQSLILAPLFVWYEFLFRLGFFPELKRQLHMRIEKRISDISKLES